RALPSFPPRRSSDLVDDLLARDPIRLDVARVHSLVTGKTVLVTGAAGSIGSELCRQVAAHEPARLVLFDRHENGMFVLENELQRSEEHTSELQSRGH